MAQHQEIERKFLLKRLPKDWKHYRSMRFVQGYFLVAGYWRIWRSAKKPNRRQVGGDDHVIYDSASADAFLPRGFLGTRAAVG